jgi:hypothetical protein
MSDIELNPRRPSDTLIESVAFFYVPDPLREPPCVQKKSRADRKYQSRALRPCQISSGAWSLSRRVRNVGWTLNFALTVTKNAHSLRFLKMSLIRAAKFLKRALDAVLPCVVRKIRGKLYNCSIRMSPLKDLPPPILSLRRNLRSLLLKYNPKYVQNLQLALSLH